MNISDDIPVLAVPQLPELAQESVKGIVDEMPWMKGKKMTLLYKRHEIEKFIDRCIEAGKAAFDLETTGLNTRPHPEKISSSPIVGVAIAISRDEGVYIPVAHQDGEYNVPLDFLLSEIKRLSANCVLIFHNFKYDGQVLRNYGILVGGEQCDPSLYEDTLILASVQDASRKDKRLKSLSSQLLGREMLNIKNLGVTVSDKNVPAFDQVPPEKAVYYATPDVMNTYYLFEVLSDMIDKQDPTGRGGPWGVYKKIEKPCMYVTMEMERNHILVDLDYLHRVRAELIERIKKCLRLAHEAAGRPFDLNSAKQLGVILYDELKLPYVGRTDTKSGNKETSEAVLEKIKDKHPIVQAILDFRHYEKQLHTYVENLIKNSDENGMVKFELNQTKADTGRFTATGGKGLHVDGYCGVNCQNLPRSKKDDEKSFDIRKALIARPGYKIVTIDYSGEELRIAANLSREERWIKEFLYGSGDLHTITGQIIHGKSLISKEERGVGKTLNFLTLYGGGAGGFAAQAKIPVDKAKKMIQNFFRQYTGISSWIKREVAKGKKRGYSSTALGRRRPLAYFYESGDRGLAAKGDRCVINSAVQGSGADIIKIALHRVSKWIRENGLNDKIRILMPIHDEIVFEIANDGTEEGIAAFGRYIEEISEIMKIDDVIASLQWPIHLEVDAEYGDSLSITNDYFKEKELSKEDSTEKESIDQVPTEENQANAPLQQESLVSIGSELNKIKETTDKEVLRRELISDPKKDAEVQVETMEYMGDNAGITFKAYVKSHLLNDAPPADMEPADVDETEIEKLKLKEFVDKRGFIEWPVSHCDGVVVSQLTAVFRVLKKLAPMFSGPTYRVKLVSQEGEVLYKSQEKVSVDAFLFAVVWLNL
jgi:DNA polymerase-1